jgi:uncharacterized protein with ParB-like and HNH nuclease domain
MEARETKVQQLIEGAKQFLLPLFQRKYVWDKNQWASLWDDIYQLYEDEESKSHFIGSIVTIPMNSVPHGVAKFVLIDGQQRLTTLFILLTVLRDKANQKTEDDGEEINDMITNRHKKELDYYKLLPTEKDNDRQTFTEIIKGNEVEFDNQIQKAYNFFEREIRKNNVDIKKILIAVTQKLSLVSIVLHEEYDNPHLVFESLNSTGIKLLPSDLIRNYFFMRIHTDKQIEIYDRYWLPMENKLNDKFLTEFIRHYLKKDGAIIKESEIYFKLRERVNVDNAVSELQTLFRFSKYYHKLLQPSTESQTEIRKYLQRINVLEVTTVYPFLLNCYDDYAENRLTIADFVYILKIIENFLIRRYVANVPTNQLDKVFPALYKQVLKENNGFVAGLKMVLSTKNYPTDIQFRKAIKDSKLYGGGDKVKKTKHLLSLIESSHGHKELIDFEPLTIEHILPQTISETWKNDLGENWEETKDLYLNTLGNLTLTAYNSELSNDTFREKKKILQESHLELNKYFDTKEKWQGDDITERAEYLAEQCLKIWPYFGEEVTRNIDEVTGTKPVILTIWGQEYIVKHWADVLEQTAKTVADLAPEKIEILVKEYPRLINTDRRCLGRSPRIVEISNGIYLNKNYSAEHIQRFCIQAIETIELTSKDWKVHFIQAD